MDLRDRGRERLKHVLADPRRATAVAEIRRKMAEMDAEADHPAPLDTNEAPTKHRPERSEGE